MKNAPGRLICGLYMAEERIPGQENRIGSSKTKKQREQTLKTKQRNKQNQNIQALWEHYRRCSIQTMLLSKQKEKKE